MEKNMTEKESGINSVLLEHNVFIIWKPEYNLGITIIDEQHRGIVSIINSLHFGTQCSYVKDILTPTIAMLRHYALMHFQTEEYFYETINIADINNHHRLHQEYTLKLDKIESKSTLDKDTYHLMGFLKEWWINHICEEDRKSFFP